MKRKILLFILIAFASVSVMHGRPVSVKASIPSEVKMGTLANLKLEVVEEKGTRGSFPFLQQVPKDGFTTICKDSVELRGAFTCDTVELGSGRIQVNYNLGVQGFDPGKYQIPAFTYVAGNDSVSSLPVDFTITPVEVADDEDIYDYADVVEPEEKKLTDAIPDSIYYNWYWWLLALILLAILIWLFIEFKKTGYFLKPKHVPTPYEVAVSELKKLKKKQLWEGGRHKDYYTQLTDILRSYLQNRFGINAMEMTSGEILQALAERDDTRKEGENLRDLLATSDFVKFAKVNPDADSNIAAFSATSRFVENTKPTEKEEDGTKKTSVPRRGKSKPKLSRRQKARMESQKSNQKEEGRK